MSTSAAKFLRKVPAVRSKKRGGVWLARLSCVTIMQGNFIIISINHIDPCEYTTPVY